jgi:hypothetical protein
VILAVSPHSLFAELQKYHSENSEFFPMAVKRWSCLVPIRICF